MAGAQQSIDPTRFQILRGFWKRSERPFSVPDDLALGSSPVRSGYPAVAVQRTPSSSAASSSSAAPSAAAATTTTTLVQAPQPSAADSRPELESSELEAEPGPVPSPTPEASGTPPPSSQDDSSETSANRSGD